MELPTAVPFRGWAKWKRVLPLLLMVAIGAFYIFVVTVAVPRDVTAMWVLALYTFLAGLAVLALAVALLLTRQLPTAREATLDGKHAVVLQTWRGDWWLDLLLDTGLGALGLTLGVMGLVDGGEWVPWSVLVIVAAAWFLVRVGLAMTGRRHNEALWVTEDEVVHDTSWGRERCWRSDVVDVMQVLDRPRLLIVVNGPIRRELPPRPWRPKPRRRKDDMPLDCEMMGHHPADLVSWLQGTLAVRR